MKEGNIYVFLLLKICNNNWIVITIISVYENVHSYTVLYRQLIFLFSNSQIITNIYCNKHRSEFHFPRNSYRTDPCQSLTAGNACVCVLQTCLSRAVVAPRGEVAPRVLWGLLGATQPTGQFRLRSHLDGLSERCDYYYGSYNHYHCCRFVCFIIIILFVLLYYC